MTATSPPATPATQTPAQASRAAKFDSIERTVEAATPHLVDGMAMHLQPGLLIGVDHRHLEHTSRAELDRIFAAAHLWVATLRREVINQRTLRGLRRQGAQADPPSATANVAHHPV